MRFARLAAVGLSIEFALAKDDDQALARRARVVYQRRLAEVGLRADNDRVRSVLVISVVLMAVASSAWLLPAASDDKLEPTSAGGQPCITFPNAGELCGHDAAAWCEMQPSNGAAAEATRDACIRVLRWASY